MTAEPLPNRTVEGPRIAVSVDEAQLLLNCMLEAEEALDEWEYEIRIGVPHDALRALRDRLDDRIRAAQRDGWSAPDDGNAIVPHGQWLSIVTYRGFYDVPRLILATDYESRFWLLDNAFDDDLDDFVPDYIVHFVGRDLRTAHDALERRGRGESAGLAAPIGRHPVAHVDFDPTLRNRLKLTVR